MQVQTVYMINTRKTLGHSFRIEEKTLNKLNIEAEEKNISLNYLVNNILEDHVLTFRLSNIKKMIIGQDIFSPFLNICSDEKLKLHGKYAGTDGVKDLFSTIGLNFVKEDIIFYLKDILGYYSNWYDYNHYIDKEKDVFHFRHSMGENWSIFLFETISSIFELSSVNILTKSYTPLNVTFKVSFGKTI